MLKFNIINYSFYNNNYKCKNNYMEVIKLWKY